jgi:acetylornithine deacetylase/succinyl-diaminopimelate desuccinylase-like protein
MGGPDGRFDGSRMLTRYEFALALQRVFEAARARGEFAESAEVHGRLYGTLKREVDRVLGSGRHVVMDIDVQGARQFVKAYPDSVPVFVLPPDASILMDRLTARGTAGHGSMLQPDNAVTEVAETVARIGRHVWPVRLTPSVTAFLAEAAAALGIEFTPDAADEVLAKLGPITRMVGATLTNTVNPTVLSAGYKVNVVPQTASADLDGRFLPGHEEEFFAEIDGLLGAGVRREFIHHDVALETTFDGDLSAAMTAALLAEDGDARVVPYCLSGGTDAKSFSRLGIRCFGFTPLRLPAELDFSGMFHGIDERVPVGALRFGVRVLDRFLDNC